jgi:hypothetical protein
LRKLLTFSLGFHDAKIANFRKISKQSANYFLLAKKIWKSRNCSNQSTVS